MLKTISFLRITILWICIHYYFLWLNEVLKNADSFAYIQMAKALANFDISWFGTWWFGFVYSLPIALTSFYTNDLFFAAWIINLVFFALWWYFLYKISEKYLRWFFLFIPLILYYTSSTLIGFNIQVLSENIYIPLFLGLIYILQNFSINSWRKTIWISIIMALLYLTRAEAFIYLWSLFLIFFYIWFTWVWFKKASKYLWTIIVLFFVLISPYLWYLHSITWEWWLTNKWSSNLRQASMRGLEKMDDSWFEKAVWELTPDKHHLMAWFAGWLKYDESYWTWSTKEFLLNNPSLTINRILENQIKLYTKNIPNMLASDILKQNLEDYKNKNLNQLFLFWIISFLFLFSFLWWFLFFIKKWFSDKTYLEFVLLFASFFLTASFFFSIFFILDRYFVIFLPIAFIFSAYFWQESMKLWWLIYIILSVISISSITWFYNEKKLEDDNYSIKKEAWTWLNENYKDNNWNLKVMERWPIVTYYAWAKERWLTPYSENLSDIVKYAKYNEIDLLVVDSLDFATYRPWLKTLLEWKDDYFGIEKVKEFNNFDKKVIIYKFK